MSPYILALDQGTSGSTALVVDADGRVRSHGYAELPQYYPQPGWVEHDPDEIWSTTVAAARAALDRARLTGAEVAALADPARLSRPTPDLWLKVDVGARPAGSSRASFPSSDSAPATDPAGHPLHPRFSASCGVRNRRACATPGGPNDSDTQLSQ